MLASVYVLGGGDAHIHRCIGAHGEMMFSQTACTSGREQVDRLAPTASGAISQDASCATDAAELRARATAAISAHDANALAAMLRWQDVDAAAAALRLRDLNELIARPLLAIDDAAAPDAASTLSSPIMHALHVRTGSNADERGTREHRFGVETDRGCYWLTW